MSDDFQVRKTGFGNSSHSPEVSSLRGHWDPTIRKVQAGTGHTAPKRPADGTLPELSSLGKERGGFGYSCFWAR